MLPLELRSIFKGYIPKMLKLLYGTKEAGTYWNTSYSEFGSRDWKQRLEAESRHYSIHAGSMFYD
jgi:hypothetical protein